MANNDDDDNDNLIYVSKYIQIKNEIIFTIKLKLSKLIDQVWKLRLKKNIDLNYLLILKSCSLVPLLDGILAKNLWHDLCACACACVRSHNCFCLLCDLIENTGYFVVAISSKLNFGKESLLYILFLLIEFYFALYMGSLSFLYFVKFSKNSSHKSIKNYFYYKLE